MLDEVTSQVNGCDGNRLLDSLIERYCLKNDAALCRVLKISPPLISKIRHGRLRVSPDVLIRVHDAFGLPFSEMRMLLGVARIASPDRRGHYDSVSAGVERYNGPCRY